MRTAALVLALLVTSAPMAHADGIGVGVLFGKPSGLDIKVGLQARSALDVVLGWTTFRDNRTGYGHLAYLYTLGVAHGRTVAIPLRLGIGAAFYGNEDDINLGVRVPLELALQFRSAPIEIYGELAGLITLIDDNGNYDDFDLQGGVGIRFYF